MCSVRVSKIEHLLRIFPRELKSARAPRTKSSTRSSRSSRSPLFARPFAAILMRAFIVTTLRSLSDPLHIGAVYLFVSAFQRYVRSIRLLNSHQPRAAAAEVWDQIADLLLSDVIPGQVASIVKVRRAIIPRNHQCRIRFTPMNRFLLCFVFFQLSTDRNLSQKPYQIMSSCSIPFANYISIWIRSLQKSYGASRDLHRFFEDGTVSSRFLEPFEFYRRLWKLSRARASKDLLTISFQKFLTRFFRKLSPLPFTRYGARLRVCLCVSVRVNIRDFD